MIDAGTFLRVFLCIVGGLLFLNSVSALAKRRLTETYTILWGGIALIFVITGILIRPVMVLTYISKAAMVLIMLAVVCALTGTFIITCTISDISRKHKEMATQISLLKYENEKLQERIRQLEENCNSKVAEHSEEE